MRLSEDNLKHLAGGFDLGEVLLGQLARVVLIQEQVPLISILAMHQAGAWGAVGDAQKSANEAASVSGGKIKSAWDFKLGRVEVTTDPGGAPTTTVVLGSCGIK